MNNIGFSFSHEHEAGEFWGKNIKEIARLVELYNKKICKNKSGE